MLNIILKKYLINNINNITIYFSFLSLFISYYIILLSDVSYSLSNTKGLLLFIYK